MIRIPPPCGAAGSHAAAPVVAWRMRLFGTPRLESRVCRRSELAGGTTVSLLPWKMSAGAVMPEDSLMLG